MCVTAVSHCFWWCLSHFRRVCRGSSRKRNACLSCSCLHTCAAARSSVTAEMMASWGPSDHSLCPGGEQLWLSLLPVWAETLRPPSSIHKPPADHHYTELSSTQAPVLPAQWFTVIVSSVLRCAALCLCCLGPGEQQPYRSSKCWDTCLMSSIAQ